MTSLIVPLLIGECLIVPASQTLARSSRQAHSPSHTQTSHESQEARQTLQHNLQQEIQNLQMREQQTQHDMQQARLSTQQVTALKRQQRRLQLALKRTQATLVRLNNQMAQLDTRDTMLDQKETAQTQEALSLLSLLMQIQQSPGPLFRPASPTSEDPALALPLLHARLVAIQHHANALQRERLALHHSQTQLDQNARLIQTQQQKQEQRHNESLERAQEALAKQQEAQQNLAHSRALLNESRANMHSLTNAIERLARQEAAARRHLLQQARLLRKKHHGTQAHQAETALHALDTGPGLAKGQGLSPVQGTLITRWGQETEAGPATGLTYRTPPSAPVYAPCSGRLLFTGDFRSFGPMVILDCGHSQRFVLAGFGHITAQTQQAIQRHDRLGAMPQQGGHLFVQFRRGTNIANPMPFLTSSP
ncbi:peptidoglycan DD-metalloendopeptidase family protein [Saccharibacter sp. EH60]|nr:peptidoglycan DD-metalloendopeptidase family protein [Saccharibacter sp. EH60]